MGDDGVGVRIAEELLRRKLPSDVQVVVGSVAGMALVGHLLESDRVVFADAIDAGAEPGAVFRSTRRRRSDSAALQHHATA